MGRRNHFHRVAGDCIVVPFGHDTFCIPLCDHIIVFYYDREPFYTDSLLSLVVCIALFFYTSQQNKISTVLIVAIVLRLLFVGTEPILSDDIYRYLWEEIMDG